MSTRGLAWRTPDGRAIRFPDIDIAPGETVAVTGRSGTGKSTLLALLTGLTPAAEGAVEVAGQPLDEATADAWRARIGWIGQAPHFVHASLRANLMPGNAQAGQTLETALEAASASRIVASLPRGLSTVLGELGHGVSGGEARRLMVARALCSGGDVILADEPTADLDAETASLVTDALLSAAARGATLVVATHDMALASRLDRTVALEDAA
ncbi:MAG: ATP-binding cassette domain-containing protein [Brucellaceae bacterium]|nr:ATP-binding cassette domain-containing protein [Brucellaceae bacterium]